MGILVLLKSSCHQKDSFLVCFRRHWNMTFLWICGFDAGFCLFLSFFPPWTMMHQQWNALSWFIVLCQHPTWLPVCSDLKGWSLAHTIRSSLTYVFPLHSDSWTRTRCSRSFPLWFLTRSAGVQREYWMTSDDTVVSQCNSWGRNDASAVRWIIHQLLLHAQEITN